MTHPYSNLWGGAIPEFVAGVLHVSPASTIALRFGVLAAALSTFIFGLPLWFLQEPKRQHKAVLQDRSQVASKQKERWPVTLFAKLLIPDLSFTMGEGAVVALIQLYFILRFFLLPGLLGVIFTISGFAGGVFSLTAPLFVRQWSKLKIVTTIMYVSSPLMLLIGCAPTLWLAAAGEYTRSFMRALIEPVYAAFAMEQVSDRHRATLSGFLFSHLEYWLQCWSYYCWLVANQCESLHFFRVWCRLSFTQRKPAAPVFRQALYFSFSLNGLRF